MICAAVSPYRATRNDVRSMVGSERFIEVFVDTPIAVCEQRDVKGMYAKARRGEITGFTGIDDPYEAPLNAELTLNTVEHEPEDNARLILDYLIQNGFVQGDLTFAEPVAAQPVPVGYRVPLTPDVAKNLSSPAGRVENNQIAGG